MALAEPPPTSFQDEAAARITEHRTGDFTLGLVDAENRPLGGVRARLSLSRHDFFFGTAVNGGPLMKTGSDGANYREFILEHFNALVAENSMKWPQNEPEPDVHDFERGDAVAAFADKHNLALRGHCLFWSKKKWQSDWVQQLEGEPLREAMKERMATILPRYTPQIRDWDANNEMLHGSFFEKRAAGIRPFIFKTAQALAPEARFFTNEYSILDSDENTAAYIAQIRELQEQGAPVGGIGIQEHAAERFTQARGAGNEVERNSAAPLRPREVWARLDLLSELGLPIHITEVSFKTNDPEAQADALELFYRTAFAHPGVEAFFLWGFWERAHWLKGDAALVRADWTLKPAARRLQQLLKEEWTTEATATSDSKGQLSFRGFYGLYQLELIFPDGSRQEARLSFSKAHPKRTLEIQLQ
jgi:GH35 family endo-1,4-beta-xylanase